MNQHEWAKNLKRYYTTSAGFYFLYTFFFIMILIISFVGDKSGGSLSLLLRAVTAGACIFSFGAAIECMRDRRSAIRLQEILGSPNRKKL